MKKWMIWGAVIIGIIVIGWIAWKMTVCRDKAKKSGKPFKCKLFNSEPYYINSTREYFRINDNGRCEKVIDYGSRMSFREVEYHNCK